MDKSEALKKIGNIQTQRLFYLMAYLGELNRDGLMDDRTGHLALQFLKDLGQVSKELQLTNQ